MQDRIIIATVSGKQVAMGRLRVLERAVSTIQWNHPNIDWETNDLILTVIPRTDKKPEAV